MKCDICVIYIQTYVCRVWRYRFHWQIFNNGITINNKEKNFRGNEHRVLKSMSGSFCLRSFLSLTDNCQDCNLSANWIFIRANMYVHIPSLLYCHTTDVLKCIQLQNNFRNYHDHYHNSNARTIRFLLSFLACAIASFRFAYCLCIP